MRCEICHGVGRPLSCSASPPAWLSAQPPTPNAKPESGGLARIASDLPCTQRTHLWCLVSCAGQAEVGAADGKGAVHCFGGVVQWCILLFSPSPAACPLHVNRMPGGETWERGGNTRRYSSPYN